MGTTVLASADSYISTAGRTKVCVFLNTTRNISPQICITIQCFLIKNVV